MKKQKWIVTVDEKEIVVEYKYSYLTGKTVLVVDDVSTTGATFNEIAKTLLIFGAASVYVASCTTTQKKSQKNIEHKKIL